MLRFPFNLVTPCNPLCGSQYRPTFEQQYLESGESKHCLHKNFFKKVFDKLSNGIQVDRLCTWNCLVNDVLKFVELLKWLNKIKKIKNHSKPLKLERQSLFKQFQQKPKIFLIFTENLTISP